MTTERVRLIRELGGYDSNKPKWARKMIQEMPITYLRHNVAVERRRKRKLRRRR
jgi:hypothetical protein